MRIWKILWLLLFTLLMTEAAFRSPRQAPAPVTTPPVVITPAPAATTPPVHVVVITPSPAPTVPTATAVPLPTPRPAEDYLLPDSASRYLSEAELSGLTHEELCFARNEIYARHGRIFKTPQIAAYFNSKSWYHGTVSPENFSDSVFNQYETANIALIKNYEKKVYGGSYY